MAYDGVLCNQVLLKAPIMTDVALFKIHSRTYEIQHKSNSCSTWCHGC